MAVTIRRATQADAHIIAATRRKVWEETYRGIYPDEKLDNYDASAYTRRDFNRIGIPGYHYYLFMDGGRCAGYFSFGPYNYGAYKDFYLAINDLYLLNDYQGRGLGREAMATVRDYCRTRGLNKFFCGCNVHNENAKGFYAHMGGVMGDVPQFHEDPSDDIVHFEFYLGENV